MIHAFCRLDNPRRLFFSNTLHSIALQCFRSLLLICAVGKAHILQYQKNTGLSTVQKILAALGIWFILQKGGLSASTAIADNISYSFEGASLRWNPTQFDQVTIEISMSINNDNPVGGTVDQFTGELLYQGVKLSDINILQPLQLLPNSEELLSIDVVISLFDLPNNIAQILQQGSISGRVRLRGTMRINSINVPIDEEIPLL